MKASFLSPNLRGGALEKGLCSWEDHKPWAHRASEEHLNLWC